MSVQGHAIPVPCIPMPIVVEMCCNCTVKGYLWHFPSTDFQRNCGLQVLNHNL